MSKIGPSNDFVPILLEHLTKEEIERGVVYLSETLVEAGTRLDFPHISIKVPWKAVLAFVDRDPMANWSHSSRYILFNRETGEISSKEAQLPPFRPSLQRHWRVVYKAPSVPEAFVARS